MAIVKLARTEKKDDGSLETKVIAVTISSLAEARKAGVVIAEKEYPDGIVVVTVDGQKLSFPKPARHPSGGAGKEGKE